MVIESRLAAVTRFDDRAIARYSHHARQNLLSFGSIRRPFDDQARNFDSWDLTAI